MIASTLEALWLALLLGGAASAAMLCVIILIRIPALPLYIAAFYTLIAWEVPNPPAMLQIAGTNVYFLDVFSFALLAFSVSSMRISARRPWITYLWWALGVLFLLSLARGAFTLNLGEAITEFRAFLYPLAMILWALTRNWREMTGAMRNVSLVLGWGLVVVAAYHAARFGLGGASDFVPSDATGVGQTSRPLVSGQAMALLLCIFVIVTTTGARKQVTIVSSVSFGLVLLVSQQRTVWIAALVALSILAITSPLRMKLRLIASGTVLLAVGFAVVSSGAANGLIPVIQESTTNVGTYDGRVTSWVALTNAAFASGPENVLFGQPFGTGYGRFEGARRWVTFAPHNWYLTVFLRAGIVGFSIFLIFCVASLGRGFRYGMASNSIQISAICAILVYGWSYSWPWYICGFLGWAIMSTALTGENSSRDELLLNAKRARSYHQAKPPLSFAR